MRSHGRIARSSSSQNGSYLREKTTTPTLAHSTRPCALSSTMTSREKSTASGSPMARYSERGPRRGFAGAGQPYIFVNSTGSWLNSFPLNSRKMTMLLGASFTGCGVVAFPHNGLDSGPLDTWLKRGCDAIFTIRCVLLGKSNSCKPKIFRAEACFVCHGPLASRFSTFSSCIFCVN